jgi:PKD repeat protein
MRTMFAVVLGIAALLVPGTAAAAPPGNDNFANATVIDPSSLPYSDSVTIDEATTEPFEAGQCYYGSSQTAWYSITPSVSGVYRLTRTASFYYQFAAAWEQTGAGFAGLSARGCAQWANGTSSITFTAQAGKTYYIQAGSSFFSGGSSGIALELVPAPANDNFANAASISTLPFTSTVDLAGATMEANEPASCNGYQQSSSAWYRFTAPETASVSASASYPNIVAAFSGPNVGNLTSLGCRNFGGMLTFRAEAGTTYYFQLSGLFGNTSVQLQLVKTPAPNASFGWNPFDPSSFDAVQFFDQSSDPGQVGFSSAEWEFGDGGAASSPGCCPSHRYLADGIYHVKLTVTTVDGRVGSITRDVEIRTHDVGVAKLVVPQNAAAGQSKPIIVGLSNHRYPETVRIDLYRSAPSGWVYFASSTQSVAVKSGNKTSDFAFNYTFTSDDAALEKVTFRAVATIQNARDALVADNEIISLPTKVK